MRQDCAITILATSYDEAIDFYCNATGLFQVDADNDFGDGNRFVYLIFSDPRFLIGINVVVANSDESKLVGNQTGRHLMASFPIVDAADSLEHLRAHHVQIEGSINELPYGRQIIAKDCFGNRIAFFQRYNDWSD